MKDDNLINAGLDPLEYKLGEGVFKGVPNEGLKDRKNKTLLELIYPETILGMGEVLTYGAQKYKPNSWQNVKDPINTHYGALLRHLMAWRSGEINDKETGLSHIKHVLTNAMFLLHHEERYIKNGSYNTRGFSQ